MLINYPEESVIKVLQGDIEITEDISYEEFCRLDEILAEHNNKPIVRVILTSREMWGDSTISLVLTNWTIE